MAARCLHNGGLVLQHLPSGTYTSTLLTSTNTVSSTTTSLGGGRRRLSWRRSTTKASAFSIGGGDPRPGLDENPEAIISGEWPENFSLLSYDDLRAYLEAQAAAEREMRPYAPLGEVMSVPVKSAGVDQTLEEIDHCFRLVSGLPVVDGEHRCVGIICMDDRAKAKHGLKARIGEVMSSPAITLTPDRTVKDAAVLMLKKKIYRIPIVNKDGRLIGIVTRNDVSQAMGAQEV